MIRPEAEPTAPPATLTPTVNRPTLNAYFSALHGVALRYPVAWEVQETPYLALASDPDLFEQLQEEELDLSSGDFEGVVVSIVPATDDLLSAADPAAALTELVEAETDAEVFGRAQSLSLGGQDGATMTGRFGIEPEDERVADDGEGAEVVALFALIRSREGGVVVTGLSSRFQEDRAALEGVIESIIVSQSTQNRSFPIFPILGADVEPDFGPTPAGPVVYRPPDRSFQVTHPADWLVADEDEGAILIASNRDLLIDNLFSEGAVVWIFPQALAPSEVESPDPVALLEKFIANFGIYDSFELVSSPEPSLIGENEEGSVPAATAQYDAVFTGYPVLVDYYAVAAEGRVIFFVNLIAADAISTHRPIANEIVQSVVIR